MSLEDSLRLLNEALNRYQALNYLSEKDINYQKPGVARLTMTKVKEVELYLSIAECKRLMATQIPDSESEKKIELLKDAANDVHYGHLGTKKLSGDTPKMKKLAKRTEALVMEQFGKIYATANLYFAGKTSYKTAADMYKEVNDSEGQASVLVKQTKLELEHDRVGVLLEKMRVLKEQGNLEEEQLRNVFNKHDVDGSGEIDVEEFRGLATDLGTVPELTDEEVAEAVSQIDKSNDAEFSFEELWTWWIQDKL